MRATMLGTAALLATTLPRRHSSAGSITGKVVLSQRIKAQYLDRLSLSPLLTPYTIQKNGPFRPVSELAGSGLS